MILACPPSRHEDRCQLHRLEIYGLPLTKLTTQPYPMQFADMSGGDVLENFDFDSFLHDDNTFDLDPSTFGFGNGDGVEAGTEGT